MCETTDEACNTFQHCHEGTTLSRLAFYETYFSKWNEVIKDTFCIKFFIKTLYILDVCRMTNFHCINCNLEMISYMFFS